MASTSGCLTKASPTSSRSPGKKLRTPGGIPASIIIFITVCAKDRKSIFASDAAHRLFVDAWVKAADWRVGRYVIMPEHIHFFCAPGKHDYPALKPWVKYWKTLVSRNWPKPADQPIWQVDYWDRQLRQSDSYAAKWQYVRNNPVRHGFVSTAEGWPYQGELNVLRWHD